MLLLGGMFIAPLSAEDTTLRSESDFFYKNFFIYKLYSYAEGLQIDYYTQLGNIKSLYLKGEWIGNPDEKIVEIETISRFEQPRFTVFYREGGVENIRLYTRPIVPNDPTWELPDPSDDNEQKFAIQEPDIIYE